MGALAPARLLTSPQACGRRGTVSKGGNGATGVPDTPSRRGAVHRALGCPPPGWFPQLPIRSGSPTCWAEPSGVGGAGVSYGRGGGCDPSPRRKQGPGPGAPHLLAAGSPGLSPAVWPRLGLPVSKGQHGCQPGPWACAGCWALGPRVLGGLAPRRPRRVTWAPVRGGRGSGPCCSQRTGSSGAPSNAPQSPSLCLVATRRCRGGSRASDSGCFRDPRTRGRLRYLHRKLRRTT